MKVTHFLLGIFLLVLSQSYAQDDIDSLKYELEISSDDSLKAVLLVNISREFTSSYPDSVYFYGMKGLKHSRQFGFDLYEARAAQYIGIYYRRKNNPDSALYYFNISKVGFEKTGSEVLLAGLYVSLGNYLKSLDKIEESHASYYQALGIFERLKNPRGIAFTYAGIGTLYAYQKDYSRAKEFFNKSYHKLKTLNNIKSTSSVASNLASMYLKLDQLDSAYYFLKITQPIKEQLNDRIGLATLYNNLSIVFTENKVYDSSFYYLNKSLYYAKLINNRENQIIAYNNLGELSTLSRQYSLAEVYLDSGFRLATEINSIKELSYNWKYRYRLDSTRKNYFSALKAYQNFRILDDSLSNAELKSRMAEFETKYETEKKERELDNLSQLSEIQSLQIKQQQYLLVAGFALLLLIVGGGFLFYRQKKILQEQTLSTVEQKLLRTQMNPHFLFNALMSIQQYLFQNKPEEAGVYMSKFAKLMRQILENSRQDYISIEEEVNTLENYIQLQKVRFRDKFNYEIIVSDEIDPSETHIPPMFAQPFVENAIEHGLANKDGDGLLQISFNQKGDMIHLEIYDNGVGLTQSEVMKSKYKEHKSLATQITRERLEIFNAIFKKRIELFINSVVDEVGQDCGTRVSLMVPSEMQ